MRTVLVIALLFGISIAQVTLCGDAANTNCGDCTNLPGCGWCTTVQQCMDGNITQPAVGTCLGPAWQFGAGNCQQCNQITDCRECFVHGADCGWCNEDKSCRDLSSFGLLGSCKLAKSCDCSVYKSCGQCNVASDCQWCLGDAACTKLTESCNVGPSYNSSVSCPCSIYQSCPACSNEGNCAWCSSNSTCMSNQEAKSSGCMASLTCNTYCDANAKTCSTCNNLNGCGWCSATQKCVDASTSTCPLMHTCEKCENHKYCDPCLDDPNCDWCGDSNTCISTKYGNVSTCGVVDTCNTQCIMAKSCDKCHAKTGCAWCDDNQTCMDYVVGGCNGVYAAQCTKADMKPPKGGFDGGSFVGGMFFIIGLIIVGVMGLVLYRWKTGRKILYTELR